MSWYRVHISRDFKEKHPFTIELSKEAFASFLADHEHNGTFIVTFCKSHNMMLTTHI